MNDLWQVIMVDRDQSSQPEQEPSHLEVSLHILNCLIEAREEGEGPLALLKDGEGLLTVVPEAHAEDLEDQG